MQFKDLGRTGVKLAEIGFGTWKYKGDSNLIRQGIEEGLTFLDTAELYGNEEVVGQAIKGLRDRVFLATKANHWRYQDVLHSADESLRKLGIDTIDLYQLHWSNVTVPIGETMSAMEHLVEQGKVRFVGVSNFTVRDMKEAQASLRKVTIVSNQVRYSLVERTVELGILPYCQKTQTTVIAYSPLANSFQRVLEADAKNVLGKVAEATGKTRAQVALNWCIARPGVVAVMKTESPAHLRENLGASGWSLTREQLDLLNKNIRFRRRSRLEMALRRLVRGVLQRKKAWMGVR